MYRIRRKSDGLFSSGGSFPTFSKRGKIWKRKGDLTSHLNLTTQSTTNRDVYKNCELVVYEVTEQEVSTQLLKEYIEERKVLKQQREEEQLNRWRQQQRDIRRQQYEELKREFGEENGKETGN